MKDNICQTQFSAKEQLNNFPSNSAPAESQGQPQTPKMELFMECKKRCALLNFIAQLITFKIGAINKIFLLHFFQILHTYDCQRQIRTKF